MLTNQTLKAMQPGETKYDTVVSGLHARAFPNRVSFYLHYRSKDGKERRPKLDDWGNITLVQAREAARTLRAQIAGGLDPMLERAKVKASPTVDDLFAKVFDDVWKSKGIAKETQRSYARHIKPVIGSMHCVDVDYDHIVKIHRSMAKTPYQANRVLEMMTRMFNLAERPYKMLPYGANPCRGVDTFPEYKRRRYALPDEIAIIGPLMTEYAKIAPGSVAFIYLLMFSGARPSEISRATWAQLTRTEVDGQVFGALEIDQGKTGQLTVHLPPQAMAIMDKLPRVEGRSMTGSSAKAAADLWRRIRKDAGCPDLRMRDWRRTFASVGLSGGVNLSMVGELLNHSSTQTTKTYAKLLVGPAQVASEQTAAAIAKMLGGSNETNRAIDTGVADRLHDPATTAS